MSHSEFNYGQSISVLMAEHTRGVIDSLGPQLSALGHRALGSLLHLESDTTPAIILDADSCRNQYEPLLKSHPEWKQNFRKFGIGIIQDNNLQQRVNQATSHQVGDEYILVTSAAVAAYCQEHKLEFIGGRYSGDERLWFIAPNKHLSPSELWHLQNDLVVFTHQYLKSTSLWEKLEPIRSQLITQSGSDSNLGASFKLVNLAGVKHNNLHQQRIHELLGLVFDAQEGKLQGKAGNAFLVDTLLHAFDHQPSVKEIDLTFFPPSIQTLYGQAINAGAEKTDAYILAEMATFEGLFPRDPSQRIYRKTSFAERTLMAADQNAKHGGVLIAKAGPLLLKHINSTGHTKGDQLLKKSATKLTPLLQDTSKDNGSFVAHFESQKYQEKLLRLAELTSVSPHGALDLIVSSLCETHQITTSSSPAEIFAIVDSLRQTQLTNELRTLLNRATQDDKSLYPLYAYLSARKNLVEIASQQAQQLGIDDDRVIAAINQARQ